MELWDEYAEDKFRESIVHILASLGYDVPLVRTEQGVLSSKPYRLHIDFEDRELMRGLIALYEKFLHAPFPDDPRLESLVPCNEPLTMVCFPSALLPFVDRLKANKPMRNSDMNEIAELWHYMLPEISFLKKIQPEAEHLASKLGLERLKEPDLDWCQNFLEKRFLLGASRAF